MKRIGRKELILLLGLICMLYGMISVPVMAAEGGSGVVNGSFEWEWPEPDWQRTLPGWTVVDGDGNVMDESAGNTFLYDKWENVQEGTSFLQFWGSSAYKIGLYQDVTGLEPGYYYLTAWTQNSGGQNSCYLYGGGGGQSYSMTMLPKSADWRQVVVRGIEVKEDGTARIGFYTDANAENYVSLDNVQLVREVDQTEGYRLYTGGDISQLTYEEDEGALFYDAEGNAGDALQILSDAGFDIARLRLYNAPGKGHGNAGWYCKDGYMDETDILSLAKRASDKGMAIQLSFHYSDFWTNGETQNIPVEWQDDIAGKADAEAVAILENLVYEYTYDIMTRMKAQGTTPEFVSLGNEMQAGLLYPYGKASAECWPNLARFLNAGSKAVKEVSPDTKVVLHLDDAGNEWKYTNFFDNCNTYGVNYDIIGASYYPFWTDKNVDTIVAFCNKMIELYDKDIMIMETGFNFSPTLPDSDQPGQLTDNGDCYVGIYESNPTDQKYFMAELFNGLKLVGLGTEHQVYADLYWDPIMVEQEGVGWAMEEATDKVGDNVVSNTTLFDFDHKLLPAGEAYTYNTEGKQAGGISGRIVSNGNNALGIGNIDAVVKLDDTEYTVKTDRYGFFCLSDVAAGTYDVDLVVTGMEYSGGNQITVKVGERNSLILPVQGTAMAGTVRDSDGAPIQNAQLVAVQGAVTYTAYTDESGNYQLQDIPAGVYTVFAQKIGYTASEATTVNLGIGDNVTGQNFVVVLASGDITGTVITMTNGVAMPVSGAEVIAELNGVQTITATDDNGKYSFKYLEEGEVYQIKVNKSGYLAATTTATVVLDEEISVEQIVLIADVGVVSGQVVDCNGNAVADADIVVANGEGEEGIVTTVKTDTEGKFVLQELISGDYQIQAKKEGYLAGASETVTVVYNEQIEAVTFILATPVTVYNHSFEEQSEGAYNVPAGWQLTGTGVADGNAAIIRQDRSGFGGTEDGTFALSMWLDSAFEVDGCQKIENLQPGTYLLKARTYSGITGEFYMYAKDVSGELLGKTDIMESNGYRDTVLEFEVTGTECVIGFYSNTAGGDWSVIDVVELGYLKTPQSDDNNSGTDDIEAVDNDSEGETGAPKEIKADWNQITQSVEEAVHVASVQNDNQIVDVITGEEIVVPGNVMQMLYDKNTVLAMHTGQGVTFSITGTEITKNTQSAELDLSCRIGATAIPVNVLNEQLYGTIANKQITIANQNPFGMNINLHVNMGAENYGKKANLYCYNNTTGKMDYRGSFRITENGQAMFGISKGGEYLVTVTE